MSWFSLNEPFGSDYTVDPEDIVNTKTALSDLGYYRPPEGVGIQPWTDNATFDGIKNFQQDNGLKVDGFMRPGGPTEGTINTQLAAASKTNDGNWEYAGDMEKGDSQDITTHGPVKVEIHNPAPGLNGLRYKVDWYGNDANGNVIPEYRRPDHNDRIPDEPGHVVLPKTEKVYSPPFDSPNGHTFRLTYPPQSEYTTLGDPPYLKVYRTKMP